MGNHREVLIPIQVVSLPSGFIFSMTARIATCRHARTTRWGSLANGARSIDPGNVANVNGTIRREQVALDA